VSLETPPTREEQPEPSPGSLDPEVGELLRRLLVGELRLKVDPVSGRAVLDGESAAPNKLP
jgi:hypothetical protein